MTFRKFLNTKVYVSALVLLAVMATGLYMMTDSTIVSAQKGDLASRRDNDKGKVSRAMDYALQLGTAGEYTVFGAKGVRGNGAGVEGKRGTGLDEASLGENGSGLKARSDIGKAFTWMKQLPCQEMEAALTGGTFEPGVYCAPSAALAGQMVLDARGDETGRFVFVINGAMKSANNFQMELAGGAKSGNVYFVADTASLGSFGSIIGSVIARGTIEVGAGTMVKGRAISKEGEVVLADGANLALAPGYIQICKFALHDGVARATPGNAGYYSEDRGLSTSDFSGDLRDSLQYKVFYFSVNGGAFIPVPVGGCSDPILVGDATATVAERIDGTYLPAAGQAAGAIWANRFRLVHVSGRTAGPTGQTVPTLNTNLEERTTTFDMPTTTSAQPIILDFTNTFAIPAVIEICKQSSTLLGAVAGGTQTGAPVTPGVGSSVDVIDTFVESIASGSYFDFEVNVLPGRVFTIPVGFCSRPIQLIAPTTPQPQVGGPTPTTTPAPGTTASAIVYVTEVAEPGFTLEYMTAIGGGGVNRQVGQNFDEGVYADRDCAITTNIPNVMFPTCFYDNPGGGWQSARVFEALNRVISDNPANNTWNSYDQTLFTFYNRSNPGIIKICKVAGPGVPFGTRFEFVVLGRQAQSQAFGGTRILPGTDVTRRVVVTAGNCNIVTEADGVTSTQFVVGTRAYVREDYVLDDVNLVEHNGFGDPATGVTPGGNATVHVPGNDGLDTTPNSEILVSRIRVNNVLTGGLILASPATITHVGAGGTYNVAINPNLTSVAAGAPGGREVIFRVGRGETVVEFTNVLFRPTQLKICKVAGSGVPVNTLFNFTITVDGVGGLVPVNAQNTTGPTFTSFAPNQTGAVVTIPAGDPVITDGFGNCVIVNGPYGATAAGQPGTFRVDSVVTVSEGVGPLGSGVTVTSTTGGTVTVDAATRSATITMRHVGAFNELIFVNSFLAPVSVANYKLGGRVMTPDGGGLRNAQVILTKSDGTRMTVPTSSMGYYEFQGLANENYTVSVSSRRYRFSARNVDLSASLSNIDFTGIE